MTYRVLRKLGDRNGSGGSGSLACSRHEVAEWIFHSRRRRADPFSEIELEAVVTDPTGRIYRVPGFWAGDSEWRIRLSAQVEGHYTFSTRCSDSSDEGLHERKGDLTVGAYDGSNPLLRHGPLTMSVDGRYLAHVDGHPFLWLGDTWWLGLTGRLGWPEGFCALVADRKSKGFSVIQLLAGLYCDMPAHDGRGANEGGLAWAQDYASINPSYFDWVDLRIDWLVGEGLVTCLFGAWSYYLLWMGIERAKQHWRYILARYGAFPVVWCLAGGSTMPYYLSEDREGDRRALRHGWSQVARHVTEIDAYRRPLAIHLSPRRSVRTELEADVHHDLPMHHIGALGVELRGQEHTEDSSHVLWPQQFAGEVCYPGMLTAERDDLQRKLFWISMLGEACGYTYGANGMWQFNTPGNPFGASPTGRSWPNIMWSEACQLSSSREVGWGRALLERYHWWKFRSHPEWVEPHAKPEDPRGPHAGGVPERVRLVYFPQRSDGAKRVSALEAGVPYSGRFVDPRDGTEYPLGSTAGRSTWQIPALPNDEDWLLILESAAS